MDIVELIESGTALEVRWRDQSLSRFPYQWLRDNCTCAVATNEIPVDYSLHKAGDGWLAYDVVIEGVSLVRNYRSSYQEMVKQERIDGLLEKMADKVAENAAQ